jgi:NAD(P)-dependent dehydrogenase (short-subunit alcohol dehydrogenase family)
MPLKKTYIGAGNNNKQDDRVKMSSKNQHVFVTGAASGIGAALVHRLAANGTRVVAFDRSQSVEKLASVDQVLAFQGDAASEADLRAAMISGFGAFGPLTGAVSAAGITRSGVVDKMEVDEWNRVLEVNLTAVFLLAKVAVPEFRRNEGGSFVAVASQVGLVGYPENVAYCAAKAGVINLMRCMAIDHGRENIRANAVCPGPIDTPLLQQGFDQTGENYEIVAGRVPSARVGQPDEVAATAEFLLSDAAAFVNGAAWTIDGGYTAR